VSLSGAKCFSFSPAVSKSKLYYDRVSRPVRLGVRRLSETRYQFFFLLESLFIQLRVYSFVAPSLTIWRVYNLLLLLGLASRSEPKFRTLCCNGSVNTCIIASLNTSEKQMENMIQHMSFLVLVKCCNHSILLEWIGKGSIL
jgi:hypothetical protein